MMPMMTMMMLVLWKFDFDDNFDDGLDTVVGANDADDADDDDDGDDKEVGWDGRRFDPVDCNHHTTHQKYRERERKKEREREIGMLHNWRDAHNTSEVSDARHQLEAFLTI